MIKKLIYIIMIACAYCGCQDDEAAVFDVESPDGFSFRAIPGGAVMHYQLPQNKDVMGIRVRYQNTRGEDVLRTASYACDSIELIGFDGARESVEAFVTLCDRNDVESEPVRVTFSTEDSGPVAFFHKLEVAPGWNGFTMKWDVPAGAKGLVHIFYLGKSPFTSELDTLLVSSYAFNGGKGNMQFEPKQLATQYTVLIRTEDFAGHTVKEKEWKNIDSYRVMKSDPESFDFTTAVPVITNGTAKLGKEYLFDGNLKGVYPVIEGEYNTFLAGPNAFGVPFIVDFGTAKQIAQVKLYAVLNGAGTFPRNDSPSSALYKDIWHGEYQNKLPASLTLYGTDHKDDQASWVQIGTYGEAPNGPNENRWCRYCATNTGNEDRLNSVEAFAAAEPESLTISIPTEVSMYRYLILVVNDSYDVKYAHQDQNQNNYVTFHELEIYTKAE